MPDTPPPGFRVEPMNRPLGGSASTALLDEYRLHLFSESLLSKWGFGDGDEPDSLLNALEDANLALDVEWHDVLRLLVREHLLPKIAQNVEVYDIDTIHNPIRAAKVDGVDVDDWVYGRRPDDDQPTLTPESVTVGWSEIKLAASAVASRQAFDPAGEPDSALRKGHSDPGEDRP